MENRLPLIRCSLRGWIGRFGGLPLECVCHLLDTGRPRTVDNDKIQILVKMGLEVKKWFRESPVRHVVYSANCRTICFACSVFFKLDSFCHILKDSASPSLAPLILWLFCEKVSFVDDTKSRTCRQSTSNNNAGVLPSPKQSVGRNSWLHSTGRCDCLGAFLIV